MKKQGNKAWYFLGISILLALTLMGLVLWQKHQPNDRWCDMDAMGAITVFYDAQQTIRGNGEMLVRNGVLVAQQAKSTQNVEINHNGKFMYADKELNYVVCSFDGAIREGELNFAENPYATITYKKIIIYQKFRWSEVRK